MKRIGYSIVFERVNKGTYLPFATMRAAVEAYDRHRERDAQMFPIKDIEAAPEDTFYMCYEKTYNSGERERVILYKP